MFILKNKKPGKNTVRRPRELRELFPEQWRLKVRQILDEMKTSEDGLSKSMGNTFELAIVYKFLSDIALEYAPSNLFGRIVVDAEKICNDVGTSLVRDGDNVDRCLTKKHADCAGSYLNSHPNVKRIIICNCKCHHKT